MQNNGKDALGKFDLRSDETIFLGYSSHSKVYKIFSKRTLFVEESVRVIFDESNSLNESDAQDEEFELGLVQKESLIQEKQGENILKKTGTEVVPQNGRQSENQTGGKHR